ncbi:MAG: GtrA family protein [Candidatus Aminicenantes bacterium]|nr:GtrA family protein [Candidatus Aminicenantes bacterium]
MEHVIRWARFNAVGLMGVSVQITVLMFLRGAWNLHYLPATALAVEMAVLHNFWWHERWTWSDRTATADTSVLGRLLRFNVTVGTVSIVQNLFLMELLVDGLNLHYLPANLMAIASCSTLNYFSSHWLVFRQTAKEK